MTTEHERWARAIGQWAVASSDLLDRCRRPDLAQLCRSLGRRADARGIRVVVTGDFKQGKSSLVNAMIGDDACSTEVTAPTALPTVCTFGEEHGASLLERRERAIRRRDVTHLEARAAQDGDWANAISVELGVPSATLRAGLELVDCPAASSRHAARTATLEAARSADAAVLVSDASQPLTEPEVGLLSELCQLLPTALVVTKCDLVPHWRAVVAENRATLDRLGLRCEVSTVAARIHPHGEGPHDPTAAESGIDALVSHLHELVESSRRDDMLIDTSVRLTDALIEARTGLRADLDAFGDRGRLRERVRAAEQRHHRCESLRSTASTWHRLLESRCDEIEFELRDRVDDRMREVVELATVTLEQIDPGKDWETFEPWVRDATGQVASDAIATASARVTALAADVTRAFDDSQAEVSAAFAHSVPEMTDVRVTLTSAPDGRVTRFVREGFATLGSTSAGLLAFATLGGVLSAAILAPLTVIVGAGLGGTAVVAERHSERTSRQQRAVTAVERFVESVRDDVTETLVAGLTDFRTRTADQLISQADQLLAGARRDLDTAREALDDAERARDRVEEMSAQLVEIDELSERIRRSVDGSGGVPR